MKGQRIGREAKRFRDLAGRHARRPACTRSRKHGEPVVLRKRGQRRHRCCLFHISTIIEQFDPGQEFFEDD